MRAIELFCGAGGLSCGLIRAGIEVVLGVDEWRTALGVYERNLHVPTMSWNLSKVPDHLPSVDAIVGGPPCTDYSTNGLRKEAGRARLTLSFAFAVGRHMPRFFAMENVPEAEDSTAFGLAEDYLRMKGYGITRAVLEACRYGVPQRRRRLLVVGELGGRDDAHRELLLAGASEERMTVRRYCGDRFRGEFIYSYLRKNKRRVRSVDEPCHTIKTGPERMPRNYRSRPTDATRDLSRVRSLRMPEAAMIQTFPDDWDWDGVRLRDGWKMIGNAVPPVLGEHLGKVLLAAARPRPTGTAGESRQIQGDCRRVLRQLTPGSVRCCVTSPPYWGLRDYGAGNGEMGRESSIDEYVRGLVEVFRLVRDALADDGTLWLVIGDAFAGSRGHPVRRDGAAHLAEVPPCGLPKKNLLGLPWRVALALQDDGWILRCDIVWAKPDCTPDSVRDRPTRCHEYVFLFSKRRKYHCDMAALREPLAPATEARRARKTSPASRKVQGVGRPDGRNAGPSGRSRSRPPAGPTRHRSPSGWLRGACLRDRGPAI